MTMYSRKLKLQYLHKTTSKSHTIKIYDPVVKRDVFTKFVYISLFSIVIFIALFAFNWYYVDTGQLLDLFVIHKLEDKTFVRPKENYLVDNLLEEPEFNNLDNFHRVRFIPIANDTSLENYDSTKNYRVTTNQSLVENNLLRQEVKKFAKIDNGLDKISYQKLQQPNFIKETIQISPEITVLKLQQCEQYFNANHLTTGKSGNAVDCYRQILFSEPTLAKEGLAKVEQRYQQWAEAAIAKGNLNKARSYIRRLQKVNPKSAALAKLQRLIITSSKTSKPPTFKSSKPSKPIKPKLQAPAEKVVRHTTKKTAKKTAKSRQCNDIFSQESLGIRTLTSKQKQFKQQHCK